MNKINEYNEEEEDFNDSESYGEQEYQKDTQSVNSKNKERGVLDLDLSEESYGEEEEETADD